MASIGESSLAQKCKDEDDKPVIVRVKRKASRSAFDAFWLEISERPLKRPLLDFSNLSISSSSGKEEFKIKKVLVQHLKTVNSSEATIDVVQSFVEPESANASVGKTTTEERRQAFKKENQIKGQLLSKARQEQEVLAKNTRFEQIWRSRRGNKEAKQHKALEEMCQFYDVVRVDVEETSNKLQQQEDMSLEDQRLLSSYLPLLRELIPSAASEIESDFHASMSKQDDYVYDFYTVGDDADEIHGDASIPLVQVDEEDFYDGPDESEYETDDSNAEDNPLNDYPDAISEDEEEVETESSENESEENGSEKENDKLPIHEYLARHGILEDGDLLCEDRTEDYHNESEENGSEKENDKSSIHQDADHRVVLGDADHRGVLDDAEILCEDETDDYYNYLSDNYDDDDGREYDDEEWR